MARPTPDAGVTDTAARIAEVQRRTSTLNAERHALRVKLARLDSEAEDLAKEHLTLLRKFDSVAKLP